MSLEWMADGVCRTDPADTTEMFFTGRGSRAKRMCARCPVAAECHEYAMAQPRWLDGIWGGFNQADRNRIRRRRYGNGNGRKAG